MKDYKVKIMELDMNEERTGNVLFCLEVEAKNKLRAVDAAARAFKTQQPETYREYRHSYFIETEEV